MSQTSSQPELLERPDPGPHFTLLIEARDFWKAHRDRLTDKQRTAVERWMAGETCGQIAVGEGVTEEAIHARLSGAFARMRTSN